MPEPQRLSETENPAAYWATVPSEEILPVFNEQYETSVSGIYVIGDVTGTPLVKVAANQGREVIERMSPPKESGDLPQDDGLDVVIVGAGPAGLSAGVEAAKRGWRYVILEQNRAASTVRNFPPEKWVYAQPPTLPNRSALQTENDLKKSEFLDQVNRLIEDHDLHLKEQTPVTRIDQTDAGQFEVRTANGAVFPCRQVIVAIGRQGQPRKLEIPGEDNSDRVSYRISTPDEFSDKDIVVVGGGNSAVESAILLAAQNRVTLVYRGGEFYRITAENRRRLDLSIQEKQLDVRTNTVLEEILPDGVQIRRKGDQPSLEPNDHVIIQAGTLPPIQFLQQSGIELDGIWTLKRFVGAGIGLMVGIFIYFFAKYFVIEPTAAGPGRWWIPLQDPFARAFSGTRPFVIYFVPVIWLLLLSVYLLNLKQRLKQRGPLFRIPWIQGWLLILPLFYYTVFAAPSVITFTKETAGPGPYFLPGFQWMFYLVPDYFSGLDRFYYLLYFSAIAGFGLYWAIRKNNAILWRRNLTIIGVQWTLWWGIPTFLVVFLGTNPWTPFLSRSLNAWPLKMDAFQVDPSIVRPGDPQWWYLVAVAGVIWAVLLTFVVLPLFTIRFGKIYCSYICSCGALAETVGNSYRHRGPKGKRPRTWEKYGFVVVALAGLVTIASLFGWDLGLNQYNLWFGTFLAGAVGVGLYPFLGQRIWCRMWCPLAFWMNFWGRWSKFKISPEKGKCIDCNVCNQYCQMGIDIKTRALQGKPVTLVDTPCVGCAECVIRCPMGILHLGDVPSEKLHQIGGAMPLSAEGQRQFKSKTDPSDKLSNQGEPPA